MRFNAYEGYFALTCADSRFQHNLNRTRVQRVENAHESSTNTLSDSVVALFSIAYWRQLQMIFKPDTCR